MKKPREYKADEFGKYCDDRITKDGANVFDVVKELWQEVQENSEAVNEDSNEVPVND